MPVFIFTDIEQSTRLWQEHIEEMGRVLEQHDTILETCIEKHGGRIVKHTGDGVLAIFESGQPLSCALDIQRRLGTTDWGTIGELRVRIAIDAGNAFPHSGDYVGPVVNRTARLRDLGWGGQTLLTPEVIAACPLPEKAELKDLGHHLLKDLSKPQQVFMLAHPDLPTQEFPPLRSLSASPDTLPEALETARTIEVTSLALYALVGMARLLTHQQDREQAAEILALVLEHSDKSGFIANKARQLLAELEESLPPKTIEAATERGRAYNFWDAITEILDTKEEPKEKKAEKEKEKEKEKKTAMPSK